MKSNTYTIIDKYFRQVGVGPIIAFRSPGREIRRTLCSVRKPFAVLKKCVWSKLFMWWVYLSLATG